MVLHAFKENKTGDPDPLISIRARVLNIEAAIEQIIDILIDDASVLHTMAKGIAVTRKPE
jgi:hypothetical protein